MSGFLGIKKGLEAQVFQDIAETFSRYYKVYPGGLVAADASVEPLGPYPLEDAREEVKEVFTPFDRQNPGDDVLHIQNEDFMNQYSWYSFYIHVGILHEIEKMLSEKYEGKHCIIAPYR